MALYVRPLRADEQQWLDSLQRNPGDPDLAKRAKIVLLSAQRQRVHEIGVAISLHPINVRKWIHRFNHYGIAGLNPRRSPGRPRLFEGDQRQAIIQLATVNPQNLGLDFTAWSLERLRSELIKEGIVTKISAETIRQELLKAGLVFEGRRWTANA
jgi:transposase